MSGEIISYLMFAYSRVCARSAILVCLQICECFPGIPYWSIVTQLVRPRFGFVTLELTYAYAPQEALHAVPEHACSPRARSRTSARHDCICSCRYVLCVAISFGCFTITLAESIISEASLSPFDMDELSNMLSLIDQVNGQFCLTVLGFGLNEKQATSTSQMSTPSVSWV
jgi:hypothetical protein